MRKIFQIWLTLTIISMTFYVPFYVFSNNALDAVEELTPDDLIPLTGIKGQDHERKHNVLKSLGIDTSMELEDALDDNKSLSNVRFRYVEGPEAVQTERATGLKLVEAVADIENAKTMRMIFAVAPKRFLKSNASVLGFMGIHISDGKHSFDMVNDLQDEKYLWTLFEKTGKHSHESIDTMSKRFDFLVAQINERERAKMADRTVQAPAGNAQATDQLFAPRQIQSRTQAGNPATDKIIIFQYDGQPAYCADEGEDGVNCRGDASAFIGSGTYQDFMDADSPICIAGEQNCKLPKYFPTDIKG